MGHLQNFERELRARLESGVPIDELISWLKERMLESYHNGLALNRAAGADGRKAGERASKGFQRSYKR